MFGRWRTGRTGDSPDAARKTALEIRKLELDIAGAVHVAKKAEFEAQKTELEVHELQRPPWRRREFLAPFATILAALLGVFGTIAINTITTNKKFNEIAQRDAARRLVQNLTSDEAHVRESAGRSLAALDPEVNLDELSLAYHEAKKRTASAPGVAAEGVVTPSPDVLLRVGAMEALGAGPDVWKRTRNERIIALMVEAANDRSPLVRHKAIRALLAWGERADVARLYAREAEFERSRAKTELVSGGEMVLIDGGLVVIGSDAFEAREAPAHEHPVAPFWIDRHEVTNAQWSHVMRAEPADQKGHAGHRAHRLEDARRQHPVFGVTFAQAVEFCELTGRRLPSEIEWETAARGRSGWTFPWGEDDTESWKLVRRDQAVQRTIEEAWRWPWELNVPLPWDRSIFGVMSMGWGVSEWTNTEMSPTPRGPDRPCRKTCVLRGGAGNEYITYDQPSRARASRRFFRRIIETDDNLGFRCARNAAPSTPSAEAKKTGPK